MYDVDHGLFPGLMKSVGLATETQYIGQCTTLKFHLHPLLGADEDGRNVRVTGQYHTCCC